MATIEPYTNVAGKTLYRVRYRNADRKQSSKRGFTTKRDAQAFLHNLESDKSRGTFVDPGDALATVGALGKLWLDHQSHLKPSSLRPVESAWRLHVEPKWGQRKVGDIRHSDVQSWVTGLSKTLGATSVLRSYGVLAGILDVAVKDRRLASNPARGVNLPRKTGKRHTYLSHEQVRLLAAEAGDNSPIVLTLAYTGLRWGEATGLRVRDIDLLKRRLNVSENAVMVGGSVHVGTPKTHVSRSVPYPAFLHAALEGICAKRSPGQLVFGDGHDHMKLPHSQGGWFANAVRRSQKSAPGFPRVTPHDMRHTAASLSISAGANVKAVQRMLGHASAAMTLDVYADLFDDDLNAVADRLDAAYREVNVSKVWPDQATA